MNLKVIQRFDKDYFISQCNDRINPKLNYPIEEFNTEEEVIEYNYKTSNWSR